MFEDPANISGASTVRTITTETHVEYPDDDKDYGEIPEFKECTRENDFSYEKTELPYQCDLCGTFTDHGGCSAQNKGGCPNNCCRPYLEYDPDYTRDMTPEPSDEERILEVEEDNYQSSEHNTSDDEMDQETDNDEEDDDNGE